MAGNAAHERTRDAKAAGDLRKGERKMSIAGYLSPGTALPRISTDAGKEIGAEFYGAVLRGDLMAAERLARAAAARVTADEQHYSNVGEYDPVLQAHCRL